MFDCCNQVHKGCVARCSAKQLFLGRNSLLPGCLVGHASRCFLERVITPPVHFERLKGREACVVSFAIVWRHRICSWIPLGGLYVALLIWKTSSAVELVEVIEYCNPGLTWHNKIEAEFELEPASLLQSVIDQP